MQSFEVPHLTPQAFVEAIRSELASRDYDRHLRVVLVGDRLTVELKWVGTTRFDYRVEPLAGGFRAELVSQRISPFHAAFASRFDDYFEKALAAVGAGP
jgi:hypothetical protein